MCDDHLWRPVWSALKARAQALGPLPYAGDVSGFGHRLLLLGKAPLRSGLLGVIFPPSVSARQKCGVHAGIKGARGELPQQPRTQSYTRASHTGGSFWKFMQREIHHTTQTHGWWTSQGAVEHTVAALVEEGQV